MNVIVGEEEVFYQLMDKNQRKTEGIAKASLSFDLTSTKQEFIILELMGMTIAFDKNDLENAMMKLEQHPIYVDFLNRFRKTT